MRAGFWHASAIRGELMINGADTAWMLTSTVLVLFMTLPGLALFMQVLYVPRTFCQC
jgi:hypothetical protein